MTSIVQVILHALGYVPTIVQFVEGLGVKMPSIVDLAVKDIDSAEIEYQNLQNGQPAILGTFTENGMPCSIFAIKNDSSLGQQLGL